MLIRDLPTGERPRERMMRLGQAYLSNAELIALLLRTGTAGLSATHLAETLLSKTGGLRGLANMSLAELTQLKGIGPAKAIQLVAGLELGRRFTRVQPVEKQRMQTPEDVASFVMDEMRYLTQEHFVCIYLDTKHCVIEKKCVFIGSLDAAVVHPREVLRAAISASASAFICVHNHPSGDPSPSREDIEVTELLYQASITVGIDLLDHIIIGDQRFISLKERGFFPL
ncbi:RadC family protein [Shimazuella soli]|uniref:RadC family protein n=1 Tax=Shimazuella soli TaxID=1892854 RepID=UPI0023AAD93F|nr:DNA repair protein RadC [Shimazuella soli]